ncbi:DUF559 domain-containing protein [Citricoccus sp. SGAir0253]|uniref:DUF559 domain-containing protein n=1 Tax=Citricoccus sp. SGAir0253 TaxID=2567881 RepID=UPI0010CCB7B8|nr:DUF559 domain-containing protein [Citricoccus sp. SGAir0253]QCU77060.1 DUF559 domain-containing protein [Citricoccus sp. SGAir0253]
MSRRRPLPEEYLHAPFSRVRALADGLPEGRLRAGDLERIGHGLYRSRAAPLGDWSGIGLPPPPHGVAPGHLASLLEATGGALSHQSAAHVYGIPLPPWLQEETDIQVTGPSPVLRSRRPGTRGHRRPLDPADVVVHHGMPCTTPERTWLDLASLLRPGQDDLLVAAGDHLVKHPWVEGRREMPWTTRERLERVFRRTGRFKGVRLARAALPLIRVGADSPAETLVRLALVAAGLPEPALQVHATDLPADRYPADLGYREARIALQYDGDHHRDPAQQEVDARRDAWFVRHGWLVIRITVQDLRDDLRDVVRRIQGRFAALALPSA